MKSTISHDDITQWVDTYKGRPEIINDPTAKGDKTGIRINFSKEMEEEYMPENETHEVSWQEFFRIFDDQSLALLYDPDSTSYRFIKRENLLESSDLDKKIHTHNQIVNTLKEREDI